MIAALELRRRLARAAEVTVYLAAGAGLALIGLVVLALLIAGAALTLVWIGAPLLLGAARLSRGVVRLDRRAANRVLGTQIPPLPGGVPPGGRPWQRARALLGDRALWRVAGLLALKPFVAAVLLVAGFALPVLACWLLYIGAQGVFGFGSIDAFGPWDFGIGVGLVLWATAVPTAVLALAVLDGLYGGVGGLATRLLAPRAATGAPVRELLAESLGDHSVAIAYWLPDRQMFVDEAGSRVELPDPRSGRAWTAVERDGRPVAAIVHDAALDTSNELVQAAAAASSLAIDNERLKADLRARLEELRESRLRIVEATDAARRRIERDLHDGAQQQLVALALELRLLRSKIGDEADVALMVDGLSERLSAALSELRELARGIHPSILTDRGLAPAVSSLVDRAGVVVDADVAIEERLPAAVEAAAYFLVAEALTNVAKYARASEVRVAVHCDNGEVLVDVADDGVGGADVDAGTGLRGLQDRVAAVDGELTIDSPPGGGTRLLARIPTGVTTT